MPLMKYCQDILATSGNHLITGSSKKKIATYNISTLSRNTVLKINYATEQKIPVIIPAPMRDMECL